MAGTVYLIEAGQTQPHLLVMRRLCAALDVQPLDVDEFRSVLEAGPGPSSTWRAVWNARHEGTPDPELRQHDDAMLDV